MLKIIGILTQPGVLAEGEKFFVFIGQPDALF